MPRRSPLRRQVEQQQQTGVTAGVAIGAATVAAAGVGAQIYGANEQSKASSEANQQNAQNIQTANNESWTNYLASRGINAGGTVAYGSDLSDSGTPINAKLPLWATVNVPTTESGSGGSDPLAQAFANPTNWSTPPASASTTPAATSGAPATTATTTSAPNTKLPVAPGGYSPPIRTAQPVKQGA